MPSRTAPHDLGNAKTNLFSAVSVVGCAIVSVTSTGNISPCSKPRPIGTRQNGQNPVGDLVDGPCGQTNRTISRHDSLVLNHMPVRVPDNRPERPYEQGLTFKHCVPKPDESVVKNVRRFDLAARIRQSRWRTGMERVAQPLFVRCR